MNEKVSLPVGGVMFPCSLKIIDNVFLAMAHSSN